MPGYNPSPEQESIYNLIPRYQAPTPKQALYRSKVRVCHILAFSVSNNTTLLTAVAVATAQGQDRPKAV